MSNQKKLIFVVEDDNFFLQVLTDDLSENESYYVKGFSTAEACLESLNENPNVIVLDFYLDKENPDAMNGMEALEKINSINPNIKVIMLSGQDSLETAGKLLDKGAFDYVIKDSDAIKILQKKISKALQ
ncbi:MAG: response regulator [Crocinitomicaceae bacterium]|jgi:DNA-binding NtrC family response regulator|nr:response regulator [Crocinitomicaceae bacterium]